MSNKTLTWLNMASTRIGDPGAKALCDALQQNGVLHHVDLSDTQIDTSWIKLVNNIANTKAKGG